jgi:hypothetical protein
MPSALKATRGMWKATAMPQKRVHVPLQRTFTKAEFTRLTKGFVPQNMDDRWFIFFEKGWLYFHRSWTGRCVFQVRLQPRKPGYQVAEVWASRGSRQYRSPNPDQEAALISNLIDDQLVGFKS